MQLRDFNIKDRARGPNKTIAITNIIPEVTDDSALEIHLYCAGKGSSAVSPAFNEPLISAMAITPEVKIENDEELSPAHISLISVASIVFVALLCLIGFDLGNRLVWKRRASWEFWERNLSFEGAGDFVLHLRVLNVENICELHGQAQLSNHIAAVKKFSSLPIEGINKMKSEVYTSETLRRENLVRLFDVYSGKGMYLLVYKYMENKSLADVFFDLEGWLQEMVHKNLLKYDGGKKKKKKKSQDNFKVSNEVPQCDILKPSSTQNLCQNCLKPPHEDDGVGDQLQA
ncbi:hypothetical protein FEM48_Zijuj01G0080500 [Ziziphus jujuba var. spinosa]|uniref:Uncharacterized protein n=1 Tax=Ziziphus jujuba var. spinosa TaxID=714518 RepID=A0A978W031_ZIZJJ|nr:hypothetical protein FEM48_Zijuj01G0080500 [Ziziphus jujuba var. spinosa]